MKQFPEEQKYLDIFLNDIEIPEFDKSQSEDIKAKIKEIRSFGRDNPLLHNVLELLPFLFIISLWYLLIFKLPNIIINDSLLFSLLFLLHGFLGYQWVIYGLHEGAGHQLFTNKKTIFHKILNFLAFNSSRLMMADPVNYQEVHKTHHKYTGEEEDQAQTNFVLKKRVLISLLPGAGILFPNDYRIHKGDGMSLSLVISSVVGLGRFFIEYQALKTRFSLIEILILLFLLSPWTGLFLDRIRESLEHHLMPRSRMFGTRELGLSPLSLIISGGPWGQPCHMSHHLAPDLNWYQQIKLSVYLNSRLTNKQRHFFGFDSKILKIMITEIKKHFKIEKIKL